MAEEELPNEKVWGLGYPGWVTIFFLAMAAAAAAQILGLVPDWAAGWIMLPPLVFVVPMSRAQMRRLGTSGYTSPALTRYGRRMGAAAIAYAVTLLAALHLYERFEPGVWPTLGIAMLAVMPVFAMIWVIFRYLAEETDEYLRHRATTAALFGLGVVLTLGTFWGFLQTFGLAPLIWSWWVLPVWALGLGIAQYWMHFRAQ